MSKIIIDLKALVNPMCAETTSDKLLNIESAKKWFDEPKYKTLTIPNEESVAFLRELMPSFSEATINIAEIGIGIGATSLEFAKLIEGRGELHIFDYSSRVFPVKKMLDETSKCIVIPHPSSNALWDSYNWSLMRVIKNNKTPIYDYVYLDGAHTWFHDALAFFLIDRLLKVGGFIDFDDYEWSYDWSLKYHGRKASTLLDRMTEDQIEEKQVKLIVDLLVKRDDRYQCIKENKIYKKIL